MTIEPKQAAGLILVGHQRSGTTLLRQIINTHPLASITIEFGCYMVAGQPFGPYARDIVQRWLRRRNNPFFNYYTNGKVPLKGANFFYNAKLCTRFLREIRRETAGLIDHDSVTAGLHHLFPKAAVVGDKHPDYWFQLKKLVRQPIQVVAIYRDPRDMVSSVLVKARGEWSAYWPDELKEAKNVAQRWLAMMNKLDRYWDEIHIVRYEELVTGPERVMIGIGSYLNLDPQGFDLGRIRTSSIGKYREGLTKQELHDVLEVVEDSMVRCGYVL